MPLGRKIQLSFPKDEKPQQTEEETVDSAVKYAVMLNSTVESVGKTLITGALILIAAQTASKVIVKSTPQR
jgi:hypothetical protein